MKNTSQLKKIIISFVISIFIFSLAALIIASGLSIGRSSDRDAPDKNLPTADGSSFNILLVLSDYAPDIFNDYDPIWAKNVLGEDIDIPSAPPTSALLGYRKIHTENMALLCFDKERGRVTLIPIPGSTLVNVNGLNIKLENIAGEWGIERLTQKIHALTGLEIDLFAVFTPEKAAIALDLIGEVDYTIKYNINYSVPERGINISLSAGSYKLNGKNTVDMLRFDSYGQLGISRSEITFGYAGRLFDKAADSFTQDELKDIITQALSLSYTNFDPVIDSEKLKLATSINDLSLVTEEMSGSWQTVNEAQYYVPDETKTIEKLSKYRKTVLKQN